MIDKVLLKALILNGIEGALDISSGNDANKDTAPHENQTYFAVDTKKVYYCKVDGTWIDYSDQKMDQGGVNEVSAENISKVTKTFYVDVNRVDGYIENGNIIKPYKTIQAAILAAVGNVEIRVAPGEYSGDFSLGLNVVRLIGSGLNATIFTGHIIAGDRAHDLKYFRIKSTGSLTVTDNVTASYLHIECPLIVSGAGSIDGEGLVIMPETGIVPVTMSSTGVCNLRVSNVVSQGDVNAIIQSAGALVIRGGIVRSSSAIKETILSTIGVLGFFEVTIANLGGGAAISMNNGGVALSPNSLSDINSTGNIVCANATTIVGEIQFIALGALTGTALISNKAWKTTAIVAVNAFDLASAITLVNEIKSKMDIMNT